VKAKELKKTIQRSDLSSTTRFFMLFVKKFSIDVAFCSGFFFIGIWLSGSVSSFALESLINSLHENNYTFLAKGTSYWLLMFFGAYFTAEISFYIGKLVYAKFLPYVEKQIRLALFEYVQHLSIQYFHHIDYGVMCNIIDNASEGFREALEDIMIDLIPAAFFAIISVIYVFCLGFYIGLAYLVVLLIYCYMYTYFLSKIINTGRKLFKTVNERSGKLVEMIQNFKLTKIFHLEEYVYSKVKDVSAQEMGFLRDYFYASATTNFVICLFLVIANGLLLFFVIHCNKATGISVGKLASIINILSYNSFYLWSASKQVVDIFLNISRLNQSLHRLYHAPENNIKGDQIDIPISQIEIKNLSFSFGDQVIIKDLSLTIPKGKKICIMGPSGSGKSTLLNILSKMSPVDDNMIYINNLDINEIDPQYYRSHISYIMQSNFMFHDTIYNNIAIGKLHSSKEEVIAAAKKAQIHDFIESLPDGYASDVGVGSSLLSGGQIQRICIARALMNNGSLIFCDEPTSSLDGLTSIQIINNIMALSLGKTVVWVDHSSFVAPLVDLVILFQPNHKIHIGTHTELLEKVPMYSKLFTTSRGIK
jgi:ATP-binding cassette subfamily B protein